MEDLPDRVGVEIRLLEVLREGRKVPREVAPVTVEIVQVQRVWPPTGQHGVATGSAEGLLE